MVLAPGSNSDDSYTGSEDGNSAYINEENNSESSYTSYKDYNSYDTEFTACETTRVKDLKDKKGNKATMPSNVDKKTQNSNKQNRGVNQRDKRSKPVKNVNSSALSGVIAINKDYNISYTSLRKGFCKDSQYEITEGMATVRNERIEGYHVKYKVCGKYDNIGKGWSKFCETNGVRLGDRCLIEIIDNNEFLVKFKRH